VNFIGLYCIITLQSPTEPSYCRSLRAYANTVTVVPVCNAELTWPSNYVSCKRP